MTVIDPADMAARGPGVRFLTGTMRDANGRERIPCIVTSALWRYGEREGFDGDAPMTDVSTTLARWYADHSSIRRLWAVDEPEALVVFVALEPSSDGDDALPVWLANQQGWTHDLRRATERDVQLKLLASFEDPAIDADAVTVTQLSWRDAWER